MFFSLMDCEGPITCSPPNHPTYPHMPPPPSFKGFVYGGSNLDTPALTSTHTHTHTRIKGIVKHGTRVGDSYSSVILPVFSLLPSLPFSLNPPSISLSFSLSHCSLSFCLFSLCCSSL